MRRLLALTVAALLLLTGSVVPLATTGAQEAPAVRPMIFVHGFMGSGQQFEAQALRFASNGFPADHIEVFEHDSLQYPASQAAVWDRLDTAIAELRASTGSPQVDLLAHSQGTALVQGYLNSEPARAATVARYVNLDGLPGTVPDGIEALGVWGEGSPTREMAGGTNVYFAEQSHTEVVNSPETFGALHQFLVGRAPEVVHVVREPADAIAVSGRAVLFPQNTGATAATLTIHEVDAETGLRLDEAPEATFELSGDGSWGPFDADGDASYEFAITRASGTHHIYAQPFVRSNRWVRLLTSEPGGLADSFWETSDRHSNLVVFRNKEWWADQGERSDALAIGGQQVLNAGNSPRSNRTIGIFVHDAGLDGRTDLEARVAPTGLPFLTGIDLHIPAAVPPDATVDVVASPRLGDGDETVCVPNWASSGDRISIQLASYHHLLDAAGAPAAGHPDPTCRPPGDDDPGPTPPAPPADPAVAGGGTARPAVAVRGYPSFTG